MAELLTTLFLGAVFGTIYALLASGLVLTYRTSGVFNFAQGALGMFFAYLYYQLVQGGNVSLLFFSYNQHWKIPTVVAVPLVVVVLAPALGWGLDRILFSKLRDAGPVVQIVATIGLLIVLFGAANVAWGAATTLTPHSLFPDGGFNTGSFRLNWAEIGTVLVVISLVAGLVGFLRFSSLGIRMRAVVDRPEVSELMGVDSRRVSGISWGLATGFAALAGILIAPFFGSLDTTTLTFLVVAATAAAVLGKLESLPYTLVGGIGLGMGQLLIKQYLHGETATSLYSATPFIVLFVVLLLPVRWPPARATAPIGGRLGDRPTVIAQPTAPNAGRPNNARLVRWGVLGALLLAPPFLLTGVLSKVFGSDWQGQIVLMPTMAIIFLSLVVLSGYAGQISLCQASFAGFAAFLAAHLVVDQHLSLFLAAPLAALATVPMGALLAWRATKLPPLFLGLATLAFAALMDDVVLTHRRFARGLTGIAFHRPELTHGGRAYYLFGLAVFGLMAILVTNLRRGRTGLGLVAMRDTDVGLSSLGSSVARLKLVSFCLSAFLAGLGGAMFAAARTEAVSIDWIKITSAVILALAVIGGISRWSGALVAAFFYQLLPAVVHQPVFSRNVVLKFFFHGRLELALPIFFGIGAIGLARNPGGTIEQTREGVEDFRQRLRERRERSLARPQPVAPAAPVPAAVAVGANGLAGGRSVVCANGRLYHRADCNLTDGKRVRAVTTRARQLSPCPVCDPPPNGVRAARPRAASRRAG